MTLSSEHSRRGQTAAFVERPPLGRREPGAAFLARPAQVLPASRDFVAWAPPSPITSTVPVASPVPPEVDLGTEWHPPPANIDLAPPTAPLHDPVSEAASTHTASGGSPSHCLTCAEERARADAMAAEIEGLHASLAAAKSDQQSLARLVAHLSEVTESTLEGLRDKVESAALEIAYAIIGRATELDPSWLRETITRELTALDAALKDVKLRLHPADHALLMEGAGHAWEGVAIQADPAVQRGGFEIETDSALVDGNPRSRIAWNNTEQR